ncbi:bifunctional phosphopantothenoylcysteine decarboxylase/phosphopantothenate--cysteine ligase CoaBC [Bartonella sp. TP]|uniref:bifunctional phosphopantothenoylcysteine decarboxylase/phosphopantothenate--cysteine ligase CoaBC n=1 Tax=Bartonella sp. TP TaxID=3057550 RepID=UPI0025B02C94|nr:bifunctional phosphopantothenoylcysteine decarboxylase/phosphopantothenate--cysteine ligase CoaBC [Bartonella sp. TP]WJW80444.1 bifunctional phosphopantothenoylcysteine decarboxylase/phosphopantothenate--cysteine ligase CoaBC [Bartonella sp. TP]
MLAQKNIGLIIGGGIAAYKSLDLIRRLKERGAIVHVILTPAAQKFITSLSAAALSHMPVYGALFEEGAKDDISHIKLSSMLDLLIVAPATANRLASTATGLAQDFAGTVLLAATCPILLAPAMNPHMWANPAIQRAVTFLRQDGYAFIGPNIGAMAEKNHHGIGRMSEALEIATKAEALLAPQHTALAGKKFIITTGATIEPIDPVRYISNHSSGKQGFAIAQGLAQYGAQIVVICGETKSKPPENLQIVKVQTAAEMLQAVQAQLPADGAIFVAAVCDWRAAEIAPQKLKKLAEDSMQLTLQKNPDILQTIATAANRPKLVIGFAAETENHIDYAKAKLQKKQADVIIANKVNGKDSAFGSEFNQITLISKDKEEHWPKLSKQQIGQKLAEYIATNYF